MTDVEPLDPWADLPGSYRSIFPLFDVGVPMPPDTAVPGSYRPPGRQPEPDEAPAVNSTVTRV